jgi:hypothetical protein
MNNNRVPQREKLSSEELAALIVDSLNRASIVSDKDFDRAMEIAIEEINVRKAIGDY